MTENIRVLNTDPHVLMIDSVGHTLGPGESADVSPEDPETARHLTAGRLVRLEDPAPAKPTKKTTESGDK